jgi:hypothetical protein
MIFQIRDSWYTFDDYIANKTKKYRDQYKGRKKKQKGLRKVISRRNHELQFKNISIVHECD